MPALVAGSFCSAQDADDRAWPLVATIHVFLAAIKTRVAGTRPAMTGAIGEAGA
jgi:hypothetical protein